MWRGCVTRRGCAAIVAVACGAELAAGRTASAAATRGAAVVPAGCGRVAAREVERRSYSAAPTSTIGWFERPPLTACTGLAHLRATDRAGRSRRAESLRSTSGHGARRPARTAAAVRHDRGANQRRGYWRRAGLARRAALKAARRRQREKRRGVRGRGGLAAFIRAVMWPGRGSSCADASTTLTAADGGRGANGAAFFRAADQAARCERAARRLGIGDR